MIAYLEMMMRRQKTPNDASERSPVSADLDPGFDRWLSRQLHNMYDQVLDEDIPEDLIDLIRDYPSEPRPGDSEADNPGGRQATSRRGTNDN